MRILAYDTSSEILSIALFEGAVMAGEVESQLFTRHSAILAPSLDVILKSHRWRLKDIDVIAVGLGPGSFTGLRVGITTAKLLAWATGKKLVGVPSLEAIAYGAASSWQGDIAVMLDAKKEKLYAALYRNQEGSLRTVQRPVLTSAVHFLKRIKKPTCFVGDGVAMHRDKVLKLSGKSGKIEEVKEQGYPKAKNIVRAALPLIRAKQFTDPHDLEPLYLHPRDCNVSAPKAGKKGHGRA